MRGWSAHAGRVVLTRFVPPAAPEGSWADYYAQWPVRAGPATTSYDLVLDPGEAPVITRPTMGKYGAELLAATGGSRNLVLCGVSTDCCVLSTALAAADDGAWVRVVRDACSGATDEDHERALAAMAFYGPRSRSSRPPTSSGQSQVSQTPVGSSAIMQVGQVAIGLASQGRLAGAGPGSGTAWAPAPRSHRRPAGPRRRSGGSRPAAARRRAGRGLRARCR